MKLNKLLQARQVLGAHTQQPLPTILAYKILKFMKLSDTESTFHDDKMKEIIEKYGKRDENGNLVSSEGRVTVIPEQVEECQKAIEELGNTEVEIPGITFTIEELTPIEFSVSELFTLEEIIKEE